MKNILVAILLTLSSQALATPSGGSPSVHGMLLFGQSTNYVSHLPMFHQPHDYQLIMSIDFEEVQGSKALASYKESKLAGHTLFTLVPQVMDLEKVISGKVTKFSAQIFDGHFERGGKNLGAVIVHISTILMSSKLNSTGEVGSADDYLVFGKEGEYFAAHLIKVKPSFDFIASVSQPYFIEDGVCQPRFCSSERKVPLDDEALPIKVEEAKQETGLNIPIEGQTIGASLSILDTFVEINSIIYQEQNELAH